MDQASRRKDLLFYKRAKTLIFRVSLPEFERYSVEAKKRHMMANLEVQILLDGQGNVCGARTAPGPFLAFFAPVALEYASRWSFEPPKLNAVTKDARFTLTMPFRLR